MHYPEQFQAMTCFLFREHYILMKKSALPGTILSDDFFFLLEITAFRGQRVHYQGTI